MDPRRITIEPITRLEGHGKIEIFLDGQGVVERAYFQVPELRGFEKFAQGRPAEDMPQITSRICGVCPTAHHMASTKALDALYQVTPPPAARKIRELIYSTFFVEDHALHFYFLGGPDFVVGPQAPAAERNVLGVIAKVGIETGQKVIAMRRRLRELMVLAGGKAATRCSDCPAASPSRSPPKTRRASAKWRPKPSSSRNSRWGFSRRSCSRTRTTST
jgi:F420-non-reducing hydrogenase large subunit